MKLDLEDLRSVWNRNCPLDPMTAELFLEKTSGDPDFDPNLFIVSEDNDRACGFVMGVVRKGSPVTGYVKLMVIDEACRYSGRGKSMLRQLESLIAQRGATRIRVGESAPNYLVPGIDPRYTGAMLFFERNNYERFGETWNLDVDLSQIEHRTGEYPGLDVRRAGPDDYDAVMEMLKSEWPAWIPEVSTAFKNTPVSLHVACADTRVIAFSAYDCNNLGTGWFGPMGTLPEARGKGLGADLLRRCLLDIKAQGHERAIIPWVGPIGFYHRHVRASVSRTFYRYEKTL